MAEVFTYWKVEVSVDGISSWTEITDDILPEPRPRFSRGIPGAGPLALVAGPGTFTFSLNNTPIPPRTNGPYSAGSTTSITGWGTGMYVRLSFAYDSFQPYYKWYGRISRDGIKVVAGMKGERRVDVSCHDWMQEAADTQLDLLQMQLLYKDGEAIKKVLEQLRRPPLRVEVDKGIITFPTVFDAAGIETTVLGELQKIAMSTNNRIFVRGDLYGGEMLVYDGTNGIPLTTAESSQLLMETGGTDYILMETGGTNYILLDEVQSVTFDDSDIMAGSEFSYGKYFYNHITYTTYPRRVDTSTVVLWKLNEAKRVDAGESVTIRGTYNDPNGSANSIRGRDFVTPVATTDYKANAAEDGSGADLSASMTMTATFGAAEVEVVITNTGGTDFYTGGTSAATICQVRGKGIYFDDPVRVIVDTTDFDNYKYPISRLSVDGKYDNTATNLGNPDRVTAYGPYELPFINADKLVLWANRDARNMCAFLFGEPNTVFSIQEEITGINAVDAVLLGYEAEIIKTKDSNAGISVLWYPNFDCAS